MMYLLKIEGSSDKYYCKHLPKREGEAWTVEIYDLQNKKLIGDVYFTSNWIAYVAAEMKKHINSN